MNFRPKITVVIWVSRKMAERRLLLIKLCKLLRIRAKVLI